MKYQAVIFDLDNTLLDREKSIFNLSKKLHKKYVQPQYSQQQVFLNLITADGDGYQNRKDRYEHLLKVLPWSTTPSFGEYEEFWDSEFPKSSELMSGAIELLEFLQKLDYKLAIITNGKTSVQYCKIESTKIKKYFDVIHISDEVECKKPDKEIFYLTLKKLEINANQAIYVGDHPTNDIYGSINAGLQAIWIEGYCLWDETLQISGFHTIKKLEEVKGFL